MILRIISKHTFVYVEIGDSIRKYGLRKILSKHFDRDLFKHILSENYPVVETAFKRLNYENSSLKVKKITNNTPQILKIIRKSKSYIKSVSFDTNAVNYFLTYFLTKFNFNIKRSGILYGTLNKNLKTVKIEVIYEPCQNDLFRISELNRDNTEEDSVDFLTKQLGIYKVGWIFTSRTGKKCYHLRDYELVTISELQNEFGFYVVTCVVSIDENFRTHLETYQVSDICNELESVGCFDLDKEPRVKVKMQNPSYSNLKKPIVVPFGRNGEKIDSDWFIQPVNIIIHGSTTQNKFKTENRVFFHYVHDIRHLLKVNKISEIFLKILDFHLLLWFLQYLSEKKEIISLIKENCTIHYVAKKYKVFIKDQLNV